MEAKNGKLSTVMFPKEDGDLEKKKSFWHIDKEMLPLKLHFFLFVGGMGAVLPYQSAFGIMKLGLTAGNIAAAYTTQEFLFIFLKPGIGYLADYFNKLKATLIGLTVLQAIFCFFMISLPSDGMPKNHVHSPNMRRYVNYKCDICNQSQELKDISLNQPLAGDNLTRVLDCFKNSEKEGRDYVVVHCPNEKYESSYMNVSYRVFRTICENSFSKNVSSTSYAEQNSLYDGDTVFITQSFNEIQNLVIVCFLPKEKPIFKDNFSYNLPKQHCHTVPNSECTDLQELPHVKLFNTTNCKDYRSNLPASLEYEYNGALSAANFKTYQFWIFSVCLILSCTCISCIFTISDTACHESVKGRDYGRQRAWGAVSWGLIAPFAGFLNDYTDSYMASWCLMVLMCSFQIWNLTKMDLVKPDFSQNMLKDLKAIFSSAEFLAFEAGVLMNGIFTGVVWFYLTWFLTSIGGNKLIIGLAHTVQCFFGEVPIMFISGWMIKKFGHFNIVSLALFSHAVRFFIYSYLHNPWWLLPVEISHGFTFGSFYSAMTSYGKLNSKPGTEATTQSVLCATFEAIGAGLGCVISGICFDFYGGHATFFYASFISAAATVINIAFSILVSCRKGGLDVTKTESTSSERF